MGTSPDAYSETHQTFCRICEATCGLNVTFRDGRIADITPDHEHVATDGFACVKGVRQHRIYDSPDRVTRPMKRSGDRWSEIGWDQALAEIGAKVRQLRKDHGPHSVGMYVGTAAGFSVLHPIFAQGFMQGVGSRNMYSSATQDCANKFAVATELYGFPFTQPFPDIENTEFLVIVGANPVVSKWSFGQVSNPAKRIREIEARGGRVVVVDPRRTETAKVAGQHIPIRPGTDVFFYLALLNELLHLDAFDATVLEQHTTGIDEVKKLAADWPAERCAQATGIDPETLRELAAAYAKADGAVLYSSTGVNMGGRGALAFWLQEVINAATGNLDRVGGAIVGEGIFDFAKFGKRTKMFIQKRQSRIGGFGAVNDAMPGGILADEILTPGKDRLRAMFVTGGNPLVTMADSARLREAFNELELLVSLDIFRNETGSLAHYILPCTTPLERPDLPFVFPLFMGMQTKPYLQATEALLPPAGEARDETTIYLDLARESGVNVFDSAIAQRLLNAATRWNSRGGRRRQAPQRQLLSLLMRITGNGSFDKLLREPHGRTRPGHAPGSFLPDRIITPDRKVRLAPEALMQEAAQLDSVFEQERESHGTLRLITKRHTLTHNSWTHNEPSFVQGKHQTNRVYMNPDDAQATGLDSGELADVSTANATIRLPVEVLPDLSPGTVAVPHGWGHQHADGLTTANRTGGVNVNLLAASGPGSVERISGMSKMTAIDVRVTPAAGPKTEGSWSGV